MAQDGVPMAVADPVEVKLPHVAHADGEKIQAQKVSRQRYTAIRFIRDTP
jgi:hypothetical protein